MDEAPYIEIRTSPEEAAEFVDRLLNEPEFREELERGGDSALGALARYNIHISPELVAESVELPDRDELESALREMDEGEFAPEPKIKFWPWPVFWALIKFRKFITFER